MLIRFHCPTEKCVAIIEYEPLETCGETMACPRCHVQHPIAITESIRDRQMMDACAVCGCREFFIRKDFPQKLGLLVVVVFGVTAIYLFTKSVLLAWGVLAAGVVVDLVIYFFTKTVTTCYNCRADYRGDTPNPDHEGFDLATSEKY